MPAGRTQTVYVVTPRAKVFYEETKYPDPNRKGAPIGTGEFLYGGDILPDDFDPATRDHLISIGKVRRYDVPRPTRRKARS